MYLKTKLVSKILNKEIKIYFIFYLRFIIILKVRIILTKSNDLSNVYFNNK